MKQFVLFFISLFLLGVGARSQEMYQKKVFISYAEQRSTP